MIELNDELCQAMSELPDEPVRLVDAATRQTFVPVRSEICDTLKGSVYDDADFPITISRKRPTDESTHG